MPVNEKTVKLDGFSGLSTKNRPVEHGVKGLAKAENVDISRAFKPRRRKGAQQVYNGAVDTSWSDNNHFLFISGDTLYRLNSNYTATSIRTGLTPGGRLVAKTLGNNIYYSNGFETGVVANGNSRSLGITRPASGLSVSQIAGILPAGSYQANCVFVRDDGQESGTDINKVINLTANSGVSFTNIPVSSGDNVTSVDLYLSTPDGEVIYKVGSVSNGTTSFKFTGGVGALRAPIRTQFLAKPAAFNEIDFFKSRMLFANGEYLTYSEPFAYEIVNPASNYIPIPGKVQMMGVVTSSDRSDGIYVGTNNATYFLQGSEITDVHITQVTDFGVVPYTQTYMPGETLLDGGTPTPLPVWVSQYGLCVGLPGGQIIHLTENQVEIPRGLKGSTLFRRQEGQNHLVFSIKS